MYNPEKLATLGNLDTRQRQTKQRTLHNICWTNYAETNTNNINKAWTLLQKTGGKDEPNIVFMR